jgi:hypothetical protein
MISKATPAMRKYHYTGGKAGALQAWLSPTLIGLLQTAMKVSGYYDPTFFAQEIVDGKQIFVTSNGMKIELIPVVALEGKSDVYITYNDNIRKVAPSNIAGNLEWIVRPGLSTKSFLNLDVRLGVGWVICEDVISNVHFA